jgi:hypothetical protein
MTTLVDAARNLQIFTEGSLKTQISQLEDKVCELENVKATYDFLSIEKKINSELLISALALKQAAGQIHEIIHAVGILMLLPHILLEDEKIEALSLAAGNTGRPFDLVTNKRIAEFKFIRWKGGSETIRQNSIFKDFFYLAEYSTQKQRFLYVIDTKYPLKFFNGKRGLSSVMSKNRKLEEDFTHLYEGQFSTVSDYFKHFPENWVRIVDSAKYLPELMNVITLTEFDDT